ncbi:L-2-amino-thiazoline-4-carboxylic acid hydrolase [Dinoroseobacter sp. S76]|uniref:L-2-amino-thiazoline-4-carboxylic acid hydrolase n=1 Tax=Dinoroseobacter sp. S76 TaxID=3415124 RepID=UPI003C79F461
MRRLMAWLWQGKFARNLSRQSGRVLRARDLRREIGYLPQGQMPGRGGAQRFNLTLAQSLLAATGLLERDGGLPRDESVRIAGAAFARSGRWAARGATRLWLKLDPDPFAGVQARGPAKLARALWGDGMSVEDRHGAEDVSLCVLVCPFHGYFQSVGRPDLTPVLCAWDAAWQDDVNRSAKPIRVEIRSTIARGAEICEFAFQRADPAGAEARSWTR